MSPGMPDETLLAFDFGTRRIGVAIGTFAEGGRLTTARALTVIEAEANAARFAAIEALIREWQPTRLLVGEPRHADGTAHDMTARSERFANQLRGRFKLPVEAVDERLSSVEAERALVESASVPSRQLRSWSAGHEPARSPGAEQCSAKPRAHRRVSAPLKPRLDAEAARVILERWMDAQRAQTAATG